MYKQTKCMHCDSESGFYRLERGLWCNACGHRRDERKEMNYAPTTAPEIQARRIQLEAA